MSEFATPDISHLGQNDYEFVYEPAEDSFLMLDALEKEATCLRSLSPAICLEVGSGSGIVSTFLAAMLGSNSMYMCTDINPKAAEISKRTGNQNNVSLLPVVTDLVTALLPRLVGQIDLLLFNPPYVVTPSEEIGSNSIEASWAGGKDGREVLDRLLPHVSRLLAPKGIFYLVVIKENKPDDIRQILEKDGLSMSVVMERRSGPERLSILKFSRK